MKKNLRLLILCLAFIGFGLLRDIDAAAKEGEWVRIPSKWLLSRFVRPSTAPAHTYRVALAVPPGSKQARVAQSSGIPDVDELAGDYAMVSIQNNGPLKALAKTKELYFQFVITPPMLDVKMRSKEGQRPIPPGQELYMPSADTFYVKPNQNETTARRGKLVVIFPPQGGYASEALVTLSTGSPAVDRYFLHTAALNWQTSRKSSQEQVLRRPFGARAPQRWESIQDQ
jgi:hypothetical protein